MDSLHLPNPLPRFRYKQKNLALLPDENFPTHGLSLIHTNNSSVSSFISCTFCCNCFSVTTIVKFIPMIYVLRVAFVVVRVLMLWWYPVIMLYTFTMVLRASCLFRSSLLMKPCIYLTGTLLVLMWSGILINLGGRW